MGTPELTLNQETENTTQNTRRLSPIEAPGGAETAAAVDFPPFESQEFPSKTVVETS